MPCHAMPNQATSIAWRSRGLLGLVVVLGLSTHILIHTHATQLAAAGRMALSRAHPSTIAVALPFTASRGKSLRSSAVVASSCRSRGALSVLLVHEHHLKPIGSDLRLLGVAKQLRALGHTVSFLFRGHVPVDQRSPPTAELAALIGSSHPAEFVLSVNENPPQPPAIYEHHDLPALAVLARFGWFDAMLPMLWFWRDPMASAAELLLPTLALHAPPERRPFVGILSDDAHSAKAVMMSEWESDDDRKALWREKASTLPPRQRAVYSLADAVIHISAADSALERSTFNRSCAHWRVLRMSPRGVRQFDGTPPSTLSSPLSVSASTSVLAHAGEAFGTNAHAQPQQPQQGTQQKGLRIGFVGEWTLPTSPHLNRVPSALVLMPQFS